MALRKCRIKRGSKVVNAGAVVIEETTLDKAANKDEETTDVRDDLMLPESAKKLYCITAWKVT